MNSLLRPLFLVVVLTFAFTAAASAQESVQHKPDIGTWIDSGETVVVIPKSRLRIAAYSVTKATWSSVEFDAPLEKSVNVMTHGTLAAFQTKDSVYGYSAATATWSRLKLPPDAQATFIIDGGKISVYVLKKAIYIFGVNGETWSGVSLESGEALVLEK